MKISDAHTFYEFSVKNAPVLSVKPGSTVEFETKDALSNVLKRPEDRLKDTTFDKSKVNPATGPVYIEGAEPGDALEVKIERIRLREQAVITCQENLGVLGDWFEETTFKITPIRDGRVVFDSRVSIPADPMIGVLGVTPADGDASTARVGSYGGNMDNTMAREGATLYLPVFVKGALFGVGDVHAVMGDGEINCSAVEAAAEVTLRFGLRKGVRLKNPVLVDDRFFSTIASEDNLEAAVFTSTREMAEILVEKLPITPEEVTMLMSAAGHSQVCQVVSHKRTARYLMPRSILDAYGFTF